MVFLDMTESDDASNGYVDPRTVPFTAPQRDESYRTLMNCFDIHEVKSLCTLLLHKRHEIFTGANLLAIGRYSTVRIGSKEFPIVSNGMRYLLRMIDHNWKKEEVLKDLSERLQILDPQSDLNKLVDEHLGSKYETSGPLQTEPCGLNGD